MILSGWFCLRFRLRKIPMLRAAIKTVAMAIAIPIFNPEEVPELDRVETSSGAVVVCGDTPLADVAVL